MRRVPAVPIVIVVFAAVLISRAQSDGAMSPSPSPPLRYAPSSSLSTMPEPEGGRVQNGHFTNDYFQLDVPLLDGWQEDMKGPVPSATGYYALGALRTQGELKGTVFIDAQDIFFSSYPIHNLMEFAQRKEHQAVAFFQDMVDKPSQELQLAGHRFARVDFSGAGYHHAAFSTIVRCHVITVEIASRFPDVFKQLEENMSHVSLLNISDPELGGGPVPVCVKDYASDATVLHRVLPAMVGRRFTKVPARFVIGADGRVKHIHVINAAPDQAKSVEEALAQWTFKPYVQGGRPVEVETGILFEFPPKGQMLGGNESTF